MKTKKQLLCIIVVLCLLLAAMPLSASAYFNDEDLEWGCDHFYDHACDVTCNVCGAVRDASDHVYDHACDVTCNVCGAVRDASDHVYSHACDAICNVCGDVREVLGHEYSYDLDLSCNVCGAVRGFDPPISFGGTSVSEDVGGLAFRFNVAVDGMKVDKTTAIYDEAIINGYKVLGMGAVASNSNSRVYISCKYLCDLEPDSCGFAVRITDIPSNKHNESIQVVPYVVLEIDGSPFIFHGAYQNATYNSAFS